MDTKAVVTAFYEGLARKDGSWQEHLGEDVDFSDASGKLKARGREAFIESFSSFLRAVERVEVRRLIVAGDEAAAVVVYEYVNRKGEHLEQTDAEVWRVEGGEIAALTIYFDITEFREFMSRQ